MRRTVRVLALLALATSAGISRADGPRPIAPLLVGDDAPPLTVGQWLVGAPVENLDRGKVYVVELWMTANSQCKVTLPALATLAKAYPDVPCLAVSVNDRDVDATKAFVASFGDAIDGVHLAIDDASLPKATAADQVENAVLIGSTTREWWLHGGAEFSPVAFIVNADGVIAWTGRAMRVEAALKQVIDGKVDLDAGRRAGQAVAARREQVAQAYREFATAASQLPQPIDPKAFVPLIDALLVKFPEANLELLAGFTARDYGKFGILLNDKRYDDAYRLADEVADVAVERGDSMALNKIAWRIIGSDLDPTTEHPIDAPDVARARRYAEQAVEVSDGTSGAILDTLARAQFLDGEVAAAVESETKAAAICDESDREGVEKCLREYRSVAATRPAK